MMVNDQIIVMVPVDLQPRLRLEGGGSPPADSSECWEVSKPVANQRIACENIECDKEDGREQRSRAPGSQETKHPVLLKYWFGVLTPSKVRHRDTIISPFIRNFRFGPLGCASYASPALDTTNLPKRD